MSLEKALEEQQQAIVVLTGAVRALTAVIETFSGVVIPGAVSNNPTDGGEPVVVEKKTTETKKPTSKKVTAADIVDDKPQPKVEEPAPVDNDSLIDDEASLIGDAPVDYEALRSECRALINKLIEAKKRDAVVAIFDMLVVKSLKEVKDCVLAHVKGKLEAALK